MAVVVAAAESYRSMLCLTPRFSATFIYLPFIPLCNE